MTRSIFSLVAGATVSGWFITLDTVATDTPAAFAICLMFMILRSSLLQSAFQTESFALCDLDGDRLSYQRLISFEVDQLEAVGPPAERPRIFFAGSGCGKGGIVHCIRKLAVTLAAAGYGPVPYWFKMPLRELSSWLDVVNSKK